MQVILSLALATAAVASPLALEPRRTGVTATEFTDDGCRDNILIFSRGSTELGNMGTVVGPAVADGLKAALGEDAVAAEGVDYPALLSTNFLDGGADPNGIETMASLVNKAATSCPTSNIMVVGYSQGAAMVHRVVESLDPAVQAQVVGAVTFGDTQNQQDNGQINNFDPAKTKVICNDGDLVCQGTLTIRAAHLDYTRRADEGVDFLVQQVQGAGGAQTGVGAASAAKRVTMRRFRSGRRIL